MKQRVRGTYRLLAGIQWKVALRMLKVQQGWFMRIVIAVMMTYTAFILLTLGFFFDRFSKEVFPGVEPVEVVNRYLMAAFIGLFFVRFLFQKTPRMKIAPYLHLPIDRNRLVTYFQASSMLSIHNFYPMLFFVPFWWKFVVPGRELVGHTMWLVAVVLLILISHFGNLLLRSVLRQRSSLFYLLMTVLIVTTFVDETWGSNVQQTISLTVFGNLTHGDFLSMGLMTAVSALMIAGSTLVLFRTIHDTSEPEREHTGPRVSFAFPERWGLTGELVRLELLLIWRNRRPRHYLIISLLFSTMYLVFMMGSGQIMDFHPMAALVGLFASGGFVLNYGQLMFSWDSPHYTALVSRNIGFRRIVKAKLIVLQGSCVALFIIALPLFIWFEPALVPLHFAFLFYNAGITSVLIMELASRNRTRIDLTRSGGFFNYEGFSSKHWIWFIPTALPPVLFMTSMYSWPRMALIILAGTGFLSILFTDAWTRYFAAGLKARKHTMIAGFSGREG